MVALQNGDIAKLKREIPLSEESVNEKMFGEQKVVCSGVAFELESDGDEVGCSVINTRYSYLPSDHGTAVLCR